MRRETPNARSPGRLRIGLLFLLVGLALGAVGGFALSGWSGELGPLPSVAAEGGSCEGVDPDALWRGLWIYSPGDDAKDEEVRFSRRGDKAHLEVIRDGLSDDSVRAMRSTYELAWSADKGWQAVACRTEATRCWRGMLTDGKCP